MSSHHESIKTTTKTNARGKLYRLTISAIALSIANLIGPIAKPATAVNHPSAIVLSQLDPSPVSIGIGSSTENNTQLNLARLDQAERVLIPGTSISLLPPPNFALSEQFSGFVSEEDLSSIVLTELPIEAYAELAAVLSSTPEEITELFASRGIVLDVESVSSISVEGAQVPFIEGTQTISGIQVKKYFVLLGEESTVLLTFNILDESRLSEQSVINTIQSVEVRPAPSIQQKVSELPFTFAIAEPFKIFDVLLGSSVVLSSKNGSENGSEASDNDSIIIIASSLSPVEAADLAEYSTYLLNSTAGFESATVVEQAPIEFAGSSGYFVQAELQDNVVLQYLAVQPDNFYLRMVVIADKEKIDQLLPVVQEIQASVAVR